MGNDRFEKLEASLTVPSTESSRRFENVEVLFGGGAKVAIAIGSPRETVMLPIEKVLDNPFNARQIYSPEILKERAASIATNGQLQAAAITPAYDKEGYYYLIDGHYRKKGLIAAGKTEILCDIHAIDNPLDLYRLSFTMNEQRDPQTVLDNAFAWKKLFDIGQVTEEQELCAITGLSAGTINKTMALLDLPQSILEMIREAPAKFGMSVGYELTLYYKSCGETLATSLTRQIILEDMSYRDIQTLRKSAENATPRKTREQSRQYRIMRGGTGSLKEFDSGRLVLDVKFSSQAQMTEIKEYLIEKLKIGEGEKE